MKKIVFLSAMLLVIAAACQQEPVSPVAGAWDLIYSKEVKNDSAIVTHPDIDQGNTVKMWCKNYWMFVGQYKEDSIQRDTYGAGSYTLEGIVYKEKIKNHVNPDYVGKTLRMRIVVANDTLTQVWPADEQGEIDKRNYTAEKYVRIK